MTLMLSALMALLPLLGVLWIALQGSLLSVDGIFMSLILLAISGAFAGNTALELRRKKSGAGAPATQSVRSVSAGSGGGLLQRGLVERVEFFESRVGQPNTSIVTLSDGAAPARTLALDGDVRNALPTGRRVEIVVRKEDGRNVLAEVSYA
ncbi:MAG TPA: hypothetical protein VLV49_17065 [Terriglobales bacterium]|nr:hypothetical protein [Terriglobales bacterium]